MNFDKKIIAKNFSRAAKNYDEFAQIQKISAQKLVALTSPFIKKNSSILDLGSGTSFIAKQLSTHKIFEVDLALDMLNSWRDRPSNIVPIQADIENLPFKKNSFDVIISSFSLQWIFDFEKNFLQFFSLLKSNGILAFCLPTDETLHELKSAKIFPINDFPHSENLRLILKKCGFVEKKFVKETSKQNFKNGYNALKSLKKIGANYAFKKSKPLTKTQLKQFDNFCLKYFSTTPKSIAVSWSVSFFILSKNSN